MNCDHCKDAITDLSFIHIHVGSPLMEDAAHGLLCGSCSLVVSEFLCPELLDDPTYIKERQSLMKSWRDDSN